MKFLKKGEESLRIAATFIVTLLIWEAAVRLFHVRPFVLPAPSAIFSEFLATPAYLAKNALYTLYSTFFGFALAVIIGFILAVALLPLTAAARPVPRPWATTR